jgi:hypothetical protein
VTAEIGKRRSADCPEIDRHDFQVRAGPAGNPASGFQLGIVPLTIIHCQGMAFEALITGNCQRGGRIQPTRQQNHGLWC